MSAFWETFGSSSSVEEESVNTTPIVSTVLSTYGIPYSSNVGGPLSGFDIKHMPALDAIKMSLLEASGGAFTNGLYELAVNEHGIVYAYQAGKAIYNYVDEYTTFQTVTVTDKCSGVTVQGRRPRAHWVSTDWLPIWGDGPKEVLDYGTLMSDCLMPNYSQHSAIVYKDPNLTTGSNGWADNIDSLYESRSPYDTILGYAYEVNLGSNATIYTTIERSATTFYPIKLDSIGTLVRPASIDMKGDSSSCWEGMGTTVEGGVPIELPDDFSTDSNGNSTFIKVDKVYFIGQLLTIFPRPKTPGAAILDESSRTPYDFGIQAIVDDKRSVFRLSEGTHYAVAYDSDFKPSLVFANLSDRLDQFIYGEGASIDILPIGLWYENEQKTNLTDITIVPLSPNTAMWVSAAWVSVELAVPSLRIFDPNGQENIANLVANDLEFNIKPIIVNATPAKLVDETGTLLNDIDSILDHDPTTAQDMQDTKQEIAMDKQDGGGGINLTLSFIDDPSGIAAALYAYYNYGNVTLTVHTCGPNEAPILGAMGSSGIINEIVYSYNDSSSYTISVSEGPMVVGGPTSAAFDTTPKGTEDLNIQGIIIQDSGNGVDFKVRLDNLGDRQAINMCGAVLRVGDRVSCSVHNNPVEM